MTESRTAGLLGCRFPTMSCPTSGVAAAVHIWTFNWKNGTLVKNFWQGNSLKTMELTSRRTLVESDVLLW